MCTNLNNMKCKLLSMVWNHKVFCFDCVVFPGLIKKCGTHICGDENAKRTTETKGGAIRNSHQSTGILLQFVIKGW